MDNADSDLLSNLVESHPHLRKLYKHHQKLEKEIERFGRYAVYSYSAGLKYKELKIKKLHQKEMIVAELEYLSGKRTRMLDAA